MPKGGGQKNLADRIRTAGYADLERLRVEIGETKAQLRYLESVHRMLKKKLLPATPPPDPLPPAPPRPPAA